MSLNALFGRLPLRLHDCSAVLLCVRAGVCDHVHASVCSCCMCQNAKDKHRLSACLPAAPVIDVDGNTQTAAEELLTHERQTRWLAPSFDGQISNRRSVHLSPIDGFIYSKFNLAFKTWLRISYVLQYTVVVVLIGFLLSHFILHFPLFLLKLCNYILLQSAS